MPEPFRQRARRNRTVAVSPAEREELASTLLRPHGALTIPELENKIIHGDIFEVAKLLPERFVDLLILDPPYSIAKRFNDLKTPALDDDGYFSYLESWLPLMTRLLKPDASVYLCGDWRCSAAGYLALSRRFKIRNRIVWQREKGRGARSNWKNGCEDIWFATVSDRYHFDVDAVKQLRKVRAPYRENGIPKDWCETPDGRYRLTCPSNFWDDISVPFWSMPENTDHPTQKPEKLLAKLILASSRPGDMIFDPFMGSGSAPVTAKKLGRRFCGVEIDREYCCFAAARLRRAETDTSIQGYENGLFLERNTTLPGKTTGHPRPPQKDGKTG